MDVGPRSFLLFWAMIGLLGLHLWLLVRVTLRGDPFLASLLVVAVSLFSWRAVHYWSRYRRPPASEPAVEPHDERKQARNWIFALSALLALHSGLFAVVAQRGELLFAGFLAVAVGVFVYRLVHYGRRLWELRESA